MFHSVLDRITGLQSRVNDAWRILDLDARKQEIAALEAET
jgi:hypothetical protein